MHHRRSVWVKSTHLIKSCLKTRKKEKMWKQKKFLHKAQSKRLFWNGIRSFLRRADVRWSTDVIYHNWRISLICGSGIVIEVRKFITHRNLIPTNYVIVLDSNFNLTNRLNLISVTGFNTIFVPLVVAYFGPPCTLTGQWKRYITGILYLVFCVCYILLSVFMSLFLYQQLFSSIHRSMCFVWIYCRMYCILYTLAALWRNRRWRLH